MLDRILRLFESSETDVPEVDAQERVRLASCALLVEMAQADSDFADVELKRIIDILRQQHGLSEQHAQELIKAAQAELDDSVHLWRFTNWINQNCSVEEKLNLIELIWQVIYADGKLDRYEDYLVHRLANLLNLTHRQLIDAKLRVLKEDLSD